jgi:hypothetical protein
MKLYLLDYIQKKEKRIKQADDNQTTICDNNDAPNGW